MRRAVFAAFILGFSAPAFAACPVASVAPITAPCVAETDGVYILGTNLDGASLGQEIPAIGTQIPVIKIAPGVTSFSLDCNGNAITNTGGYSNRGVGVGGINVANVAISNCAIFGDGMLFGVSIDNSAIPAYGHITVTHSSISASFRGVLIRSNYATVSHNAIFNVGGQQIWSGGFSIGIEIKGTDPVISDNRVWRLWNYFHDEVVGIACGIDCNNGVVSGNTVENDRLLPNSYAFWLGPASAYLVENNAVSSWNFGYTATSQTDGVFGTNSYTNTTTPLLGIDPPAWTIE